MFSETLRIDSLFLCWWKNKWKIKIIETFLVFVCFYLTKYLLLIVRICVKGVALSFSFWSKFCLTNLEYFSLRNIRLICLAHARPDWYTYLPCTLALTPTRIGQHRARDTTPALTFFHDNAPLKIWLWKDITFLFGKT